MAIGNELKFDTHFWINKLHHCDKYEFKFFAHKKLSRKSFEYFLQFLQFKYIFFVCDDLFFFRKSKATLLPKFLSFRHIKYMYLSLYIYIFVFKYVMEEHRDKWFTEQQGY